MTVAHPKRGVSEEAQVIFQRGIVPATRAEKRLLASIGGRQTQCTGLSFLESREDAEANERSGYCSVQRDKIAQVVLPETVRKRYEVLVMVEPARVG